MVKGMRENVYEVIIRLRRGGRPTIYEKSADMSGCVVLL